MSSTSDNNVCALRHDPDVWMSDGNVVLAVKDARGVAWGIRCHQSILARDSPVFSTLFTLKPPSKLELCHGAPLVTLSDPYEDMRALLRMLYDPVKYLPKFETRSTSLLSLRGKELNIGDMGGALRLSHKYEMNSLRTHLGKILEAHWLCTLEDWDQISDTYRAVEADGGVVNAVEAILLAEQAELTRVLATAYYHVNRWRRSLKISDAIGGGGLLQHHRSVQLLQNLQGRHHLRLAEGREHFQTLLPGLVEDDVISKVSGKCACDSERSNSCTATIKDIYRAHVQLVKSSNELVFDPLFALQKLKSAVVKHIGTLPLKSQPSPRCLWRLTTAIDACREYIWSDLDYTFGLESRVSGEEYDFGSYFDSTRGDVDVTCTSMLWPPTLLT